MAVGLQLTLVGALLLSKAITGKKLEFTRGAIGNARINDKIIEPTAEQMDNLNSLIHEKMSVPIVGYELRENGDIGVTVRLKNETVASNFQIREIGLFAKDPDTESEVLYGYYYDSVGDKMHASSSYVVLEYYLELITTIANAKNVTCNVVVVDKVKPGAGLSRNADSLNVNCGQGISISAYNNLYIKTAAPDEKGGVRITGDDGLEMDGSTLKANYNNLPTMSTTVKGGAKVGKNLYMDGDSLNSSIPTASQTVKGGVVVGKNLYMDGDSLNCSIEPYDDSLITGRLNQLEINQSNLYIKLDADYQLGITANLLLVEDFVDCDCINRHQAQANAVVSDATTHSKRINVRDKITGFNAGYYVTLVEGDKSCDKKIFNITGSPVTNSDDYNYHVTFEGESGELENMEKPIMYRTTAAINGGVAYGPGNATKAFSTPYTWTGYVQTTPFPATLNTTAGLEARFELSGDYSLTSDGFFTIA